MEKPALGETDKLQYVYEFEYLPSQLIRVANFVSKKLEYHESKETKKKIKKA